MSEERTVQQVLARYVRGTDARDGAAVAALFTEDGRVEISYNNSGKSEALGELVGRVISRKDSRLHSRPTFYVSCSLIRAEKREPLPGAPPLPASMRISSPVCCDARGRDHSTGGVRQAGVQAASGTCDLKLKSAGH